MVYYLGTGIEGLLGTLLVVRLVREPERNTCKLVPWVAAPVTAGTSRYPRT